MSSSVIESGIKNVYDSQYQNIDSQWRETGATQKALNIIELCSSLDAKKIIDVGSGEGAILEVLDKKKFCNNLYSLEISNSGIEKIKSRNLSSLQEVKLFDGYQIPYNNKLFNLATCSHVLEHVEHPRLLLREIYRVSEFQFFEIPIDFSLSVDQKVKHFLDYGHINIYTPSLFKFLLKSEGFEIISEKYMFYDPSVLKLLYKRKAIQYYIKRLKNLIITVIPFLKNTKPDTYCVLCKHNPNSKIKIFDIK